MPDRTCVIDGCKRPRYAKGLCAAHHYRSLRGASMLPPIATELPGAVSLAATITHIPPHRPRCTSCGQPDRVYEWSPPIGGRSWWYCAACQWQWEAR